MSRGLFVVLAACATFLLSAQENQGAVQGRVIDVTGAVVPAHVSALRHGVATPQRGDCDIAGLCSLQLEPGVYDVRFWAPGFYAKRVKDVLIRSHETINLGQHLLEVAACDAPGVICDFFFTAPPKNEIPLVQAATTVALGCGLTITRGGQCSKDRDRVVDFVADSEKQLLLRPLNGAKIAVHHGPYGSDAIQIDGLGTGDDFSIRTKDGRTSHVFFTDDVLPGAKELHLWYVTRNK